MGAPSHAQRLGAAPGLDQQWGVILGRWAVLRRKAGRPSAPAHVHGSAGVWSQPKALSRLQWALLSLLGLLSPSPSPHWTPHGSPTSVAVIYASALPLPAACLLPANPHHSAMISFTIFPLASFFPTNVITSPSTSRDVTVSPQHHYASASTLPSSLPSPLPPHHTPSSPPSLSHHCPPSPAPPTITLNTALVVTPAPPSYPHPTPNHRGISSLTHLRAVSPHACYHPPTIFPTVSTINEHLLSTNNPRPPDRTHRRRSPALGAQLLIRATALQPRVASAAGPAPGMGSWGPSQAPVQGGGLGHFPESRANK